MCRRGDEVQWQQRYSRHTGLLHILASRSRIEAWPGEEQMRERSYLLWLGHKKHVLDYISRSITLALDFSWHRTITAYRLRQFVCHGCHPGQENKTGKTDADHAKGQSRPVPMWLSFIVNGLVLFWALEKDFTFPTLSSSHLLAYITGQMM